MSVEKTIIPYSWLTDRINQVKHDILQRSDILHPRLGGEPTLSVRPFARGSVHAIGAIETGRDGGCKYFAKATVPNYAGPQRLETENRILLNVAPRIPLETQGASCPRVLAYYPQQGLLIMEFVEGQSLKSRLFDIAFGSLRELPRFIRLTAQWLAQFHSLTIQEKGCKPFEWLRHEFGLDATRSTFASCSLGCIYDQLVDMMDELCEQLPDFHRPLCEIHGEFTPLHVLVSKDRIYIIDFAASRLGLPCEDLSFFTAFYDTLLPWRRLAGSLRFPLEEQKKLFTSAYFAQATQHFDATDDVVLHFSRILALSHYVRVGENFHGNGFAAIYAHVGRAWIQKRFALVCEEEVEILRRKFLNFHPVARYSSGHSAYKSMIRTAD